MMPASPIDRRLFLKGALAAIACSRPWVSAPGWASEGTRYYVDAERGRDAAGGTSERAAWRTLGKVNAHRFAPGDQILLKRGSTFTQPLVPQGSGAPTAPITIGAYGEGPRPVIDGRGLGPGLSLVDQEGWVVQDLALTSPGQVGLFIHSTKSRRSFFRLTNLEVYRAWDGIRIGRMKEGEAVDAAYLHDVVVEGCVVHDVSNTGIAVLGNYGPLTLPRHTNVVVRHCVVYNCGWDGIVMFCTSGGLITDCVAHDCGYAADGRYGIWTWWADHIVIQRCEAYRVSTPGTKDGGGFDLDWGTADCVVQYCYAHDNDGPGFAVIGNRQAPGHAPQRNILRYNVSRSNCLNPDVAGGELVLFGGMDDVSAYNNTLYRERRSRGYGALVLRGWWRHRTDWPRATVIRNTIVYAEGDRSGLWADPRGASKEYGNTLDYDVYHAVGGRVHIQWGSRRYLTLASFRAETGQEPHGIEVDPALEDPAASEPGRLPLRGFRLRTGSPCIDRGVLMPGHCAADYWGNPVPAGRGPDIGAYERPSDLRGERRS